MSGLMKAHHVFTQQEKIIYRSLSCHCKGVKNVCSDCHQPREVLRFSYTVESLNSKAVLNALEPGNWVVVIYGSKWYVGQVMETMRSGILEADL